jgi:hypothetical protein
MAQLIFRSASEINIIPAVSIFPFATDEVLVVRRLLALTTSTP